MNFNENSTVLIILALIVFLMLNKKKERFTLQCSELGERRKRDPKNFIPPDHCITKTASCPPNMELVGQTSVRRSDNTVEGSGEKVVTGCDNGAECRCINSIFNLQKEVPEDWNRIEPLCVAHIDKMRGKKGQGGVIFDKNTLLDCSRTYRAALKVMNTLTKN